MPELYRNLVLNPFYFFLKLSSFLSLPCVILFSPEKQKKAAEIIIHLIIHLTIPKGHPTMDAELKTQFICVSQFFSFDTNLFLADYMTWAGIYMN